MRPLDKSLMGRRPGTRTRADDEYELIVRDVIELRSDGDMTIKAIAKRVGLGANEVGKILQKVDVSRNRITLLGGIKQVKPHKCPGCGKKIKYDPCQVCVANNAKPTSFQDRSFD